jgi:hypothetical protein
MCKYLSVVLPPNIEHLSEWRSNMHMRICDIPPYESILTSYIPITPSDMDYIQVPPQSLRSPSRQHQTIKANKKQHNAFSHSHRRHWLVSAPDPLHLLLTPPRHPRPPNRVRTLPTPHAMAYHPRPLPLQKRSLPR